MRHGQQHILQFNAHKQHNPAHKIHGQVLSTHKLRDLVPKKLRRLGQDLQGDPRLLEQILRTQNRARRQNYD